VEGLRPNSKVHVQCLMVLALILCSVRVARTQTLSASTLPFGNSAVQAASPAKTVALKNTQAGPLTIAAISTSGDFTQTSNCPMAPSTLAPKLSCTISVTFIPTALGAFTGTLTVSDDAASSPQSARLSGTGIVPASLSGAVVAFGSQALNVTSAAKPLTLLNNQTVPLTIASISISGDFAETSTCPLSPNTLAPKLSCVISVTLTPTALGSRTGMLTVTDDASNSPQTAQLSGAGVVPAALSASTLPFGSQAVNVTSAVKILTLQNNESVPLTIAAISTSGDFAQTSNCPLSPSPLAAKLTCSISVTFTPTVLGARTGTLTITDDASNSPQSAQLSGTGIVPASLSASSIVFGNQSVNGVGAARVLTLQNNETVPLTISAISTSGDFAQTSNCPLAPSTLAAKLTCNISVTFTPTVLGARAGSLTVSDDAANSPQTAQLSGTGIIPASLSSSTIVFASQAVNGTSAAKSITLLNNQTVPLTIAGISTSGDFAQTSTCPLAPNTLAAKLSCSVSVTFTPTAMGSRTGILTVNDDAPNSPQTAQLSGTGTAPVTVSPVNLIFSNQVITSVSAAKVVTLKNVQTTPLTITSISTSQNFGQTSTCPLSPSTLDAGASCSISVTFTPSTPTSLTGTLTITDKTSTSPQTVTLSGTGTTAGLLSIAVTPSAPTLPMGNQQQFAAIGTWSAGLTVDVSQFVTWTSSAATVASVTSAGLASALKLGTTKIGATLRSVSGTTVLTVAASAPVLQSISITPANLSITVGQIQQFAATGIYSDRSTRDLTPSATWSSSQPGVVGITGTGLASGLGAGSSTITASLGATSGSASVSVSSFALVSIAVTPNNPSIALGTNQRFVAIGTYSDGSTLNLTQPATWNSASATIATANASGLSTSTSPGQTAISATVAGIAGSSTLTVTPATLVAMTITPAIPTSPQGMIKQFAATGTFSDGTTQDVTSSVQWNSSNASVATISNSASSRGLATTNAAGTSSISATFGSISASTSLTASTVALASITVSPAIPSVALGTMQQFTATGIFTDGSTQDLTTSATWSSGSTVVANVSSNGMGTSLASGTSTITASLGRISGSALLNITSASVLAIAVNPTTAAIPSGVNQTFTAAGTFSDGSTQDLTSSVHWSSSAPNVATVSDTPGNNGVATSLNGGSTVINATLGTVMGSGSLTVTGATLASIQVNPQSPSIPTGGGQQFTASGLYSDGTTADLTTMVNWASALGTVAIVSNASGSQGMAESVAPGSATISASLGPIAGSTALSVQDQLVSISLAPQNSVIAPGANQQFTATGISASGLMSDVTNSVLWSSSSPAVAAINSAGLATGEAAGQSVIIANIGSILGSTDLSVTPVPTDLRVDISDGTTGQLFISWDIMTGTTYFNLQRSTSPNSGYAPVAGCSGLANVKITSTTGGLKACRDGGLTPGVLYYYEVQACYSTGCGNFSAPVANTPIVSDCTPAQMPNMVGISELPQVGIPSTTVDPAITYLASSDQYAFYASSQVPHKNILVVDLPGSDEHCPGVIYFEDTAQKLGFDAICVNYSSLDSQQDICQGDTACFGNVSQAKLDATGICSTPGQPQCGIDSTTGQPFYISNPADAITQRISMMLQYLNNNGYNQNGTNWGNYLSGTTPLWQDIILFGHSQGGDMSTFASYKNVVARAINLSAPPQATLVNRVEVGADYFSSPQATNIRNVYGLVSVYDTRYQQGIFQAAWQLLGFTPANNDAEFMLNTNNPIGLNCNSGTPSHNFSTSTPLPPGGNGHDEPLYLWYEDIYKYMLID
jgi:trimeric autotransporter adhesin